MFKKADNRLNDKRQMTDDEYQDFADEIGDNIEAYDFDGTVGDAKRIIKDIKDYEAEMFAQYKMGKLDPVAGDKSQARKRFLQQKFDEMEASGDSRLMTRDEMDELESFNLSVEDIKQGDDIDISQGMIDLDELNFTSNAKAAKEAIDNTSDADLLMKKYPGMGKELAEQIATDTNPKRKADVIAMVEQTFELDKQGKSGSEIIDIFKKTPRTEQADGGITQLRNGYYGGGQAMVGEDLSQIGHGADALMARNMQLAPNSMATTSTGLNYLLGEDNDTVRVPYNEGNMVLPKAKPTQSPLVELSRIYKTYEDAMPGVSKDTQQFLRNDFIQKLNDAKISQEAFMTYRMQNNFADGGPARQNFKMGKRAFLKFLGSGVAGIAGLKTGLFGVGKKEAAKEVVKDKFWIVERNSTKCGTLRLTGNELVYYENNSRTETNIDNLDRFN